MPSNKKIDHNSIYLHIYPKCQNWKTWKAKHFELGKVASTSNPSTWEVEARKGTQDHLWLHEFKDSSPTWVQKALVFCMKKYFNLLRNLRNEIKTLECLHYPANDSINRYNHFGKQFIQVKWKTDLLTRPGITVLHIYVSWSINSSAHEWGQAV